MFVLAGTPAACSLPDPELLPSADGGGHGGDGGIPTNPCEDGNVGCGGPNNNTALRCVQGRWTEGEVCGGSTPVCNGGACAGMRLLGGIHTLGGQPSSTSYVLEAQSLGGAARTCNSDLCVTGEIR